MCERIHIVRYDVENLIKLSQRFWETTKYGIRICLVGKQPNVAWVKPLGFVKIGLARAPFTLPPRNMGEHVRNPTAIRQELTCLLTLSLCDGVIGESGV